MKTYKIKLERGLLLAIFAFGFNLFSETPISYDSLTVCHGTKFSISAEAVTAENTFSAKPQVYVLYKIPEENQTKKVRAKIITNTFPSATLDLEWKGKLPAGQYELWINLNDGKTQDILFTENFFVKAPEISQIDISADRQTAKVYGTYMGLKPKFTIKKIRSLDEGTNYSKKTIPCKMTNFFTDDQGVSSLDLAVKKTLGTDFAYSMICKTKTGSCEVPYGLQNKLQLGLNPENGGSVQPMIGNTFTDTCDVTAVAAEGFYFAGWELDGPGTVDNPDSATTVVHLEGDVSLYAQFLPNPVNPDFNGIYSTISLFPTSVDLAWAEASDDKTPSESLKYHVYMGKEDSLEKIYKEENLMATVIGECQCEITGLEADDTYYFYAVAEDEDGNRSTNDETLGIQTAKKKYEFLYPSKPRLLSSLVPSYECIDCETVSAEGDVSSIIKAGDLIYIGDSTEFQNVETDIVNMFRLANVKSVNFENGKTIIKTEPPPPDLDEGSSNSNFNSAADDTPAEEQKTLTKTADRIFGKLRAEYQNKGYRTYVHPGGKFMSAVQVLNEKGEFVKPKMIRGKNGRMGRGGVTTELTTGLTVKTDLSLFDDFKSDFQTIRRSWPQFDHYKGFFKFNNRLSGEIAVELSGAVTLSGDKFPINKKTWNTIGYYVHRLDYKVGFEWGVTASGGVKLQMPFDNIDEYGVDFLYKPLFDLDINPYHNPIKRGFDIKPDLSWQGAVTLDFYVTPLVSITSIAYGIVPIKFSVGPKISLGIEFSGRDVSPSPYLKDGNISLGLPANFSISLNPFKLVQDSEKDPWFNWKLVSWEKDLFVLLLGKRVVFYRIPDASFSSPETDTFSPYSDIPLSLAIDDQNIIKFLGNTNLNTVDESCIDWVIPAEGSIISTSDDKRQTNVYFSQPGTYDIRAKVKGKFSKFLGDFGAKIPRKIITVK